MAQYQSLATHWPALQGQTLASMALSITPQNLLKEWTEAFQREKDSVLTLIKELKTPVSMWQPALRQIRYPVFEAMPPYLFCSNPYERFSRPIVLPENENSFPLLAPDKARLRALGVKERFLYSVMLNLEDDVIDKSWTPSDLNRRLMRLGTVEGIWYDTSRVINSNTFLTHQAPPIFLLVSSYQPLNLIANILKIDSSKIQTLSEHEAAYHYNLYTPSNDFIANHRTNVYQIEPATIPVYNHVVGKTRFEHDEHHDIATRWFTLSSASQSFSTPNEIKNNNNETLGESWEIVSLKNHRTLRVETSAKAIRLTYGYRHYPG